MKFSREETPALFEVLKDWFDPSGCSACPFAKNPDDVNEDDPDEGFYDCALLNRPGIWGDSPVCENKDWKRKAREELIALTAPSAPGDK